VLKTAAAVTLFSEAPTEAMRESAASGIDAILIRAEHAERCEEGQWRQKSAVNNRFGYQRSVAGG
jgi:2-keto-3-deoxy-L-rhamnonate aldolase RhmA